MVPMKEDGNKRFLMWQRDVLVHMSHSDTCPQPILIGCFEPMMNAVLTNSNDKLRELHMHVDQCYFHQPTEYHLAKNIVLKLNFIPKEKEGPFSLVNFGTFLPLKKR